MISRELISELKKIIEKEYNRRVSFKETVEIADGLTGYFDLLAKIDNRERNSE